MCFESPGNNCSFLLQEKRRRRKESKKTPKPTISDNTENQITKEAENEPQASEEATEVNEGTEAIEATEAKSNEIDSNVCVTAAATQPSINSTTVLGWDFVKKKFPLLSQIFFFLTRETETKKAEQFFKTSIHE